MPDDDRHVRSDLAFLDLVQRAVDDLAEATENRFRRIEQHIALQSRDHAAALAHVLRQTAVAEPKAEKSEPGKGIGNSRKAGSTKDTEPAAAKAGKEGEGEGDDPVIQTETEDDAKPAASRNRHRFL